MGKGAGLAVLRTTATVGKYELIAELGSGGMANVFLALLWGEEGFHRLVVLKILKEALTNDPSFVTMFLDEARLSARLNHANVVQVYEVGESDGRRFIAMEYLEGQPLWKLWFGAPKVPLGIKLRLIIEALEGLHYAHEAKDTDGTPLGIVHRDLSPHNMFVTYDGRVKLLDFGIAKAATSLFKTTGSGIVRGKVGYMAPEQLAAEGVDRRADLYVVGIVLWEAAAGRRMWEGATMGTILSQVGRQPPRSARAQNPAVTDELERVIMKALACSPLDRYATALELQADLERALRDIEAPRTTRELGALLSEWYAQERKDAKLAIEEQVRSLLEGVHSQPHRDTAVPPTPRPR